MSTCSSGLTRRNFIQLCAAGAVCPDVAMPPANDIVVGLEFGVAKICVTVGERLPDGIIKVLGIGQAPSWGVTKYSIRNDESVNACVHEALMNSETQSGVKIRRVVLAVNGMNIAPFPSGPTLDDIFEWEESCYTTRSDGLLRRVTLADCKRMKNGQIVSGAGSWIVNSLRCLKAHRIEIERLVFSPAASAAAVLSAHQRERGALVIDMGAGTTDFAVYAGGVLIHGDCIDSGGENILGDLAHDLCITKEGAEKLLIEHASFQPAQPMSGGRILLKEEHELGVSCQEVERETLNEIVRYDVHRMLRFVREHLAARGIQLAALGAGVHLTGGCSLLPGIDALAQNVFGIPARLAHLHGILGVLPGSPENPQNACAIGLTKFTSPST